MIIKILGSGCARCAMLEQHTREAVERLGIDAEVIKVQEMADIMGYGIMSTPALVIDEEVRLAGGLTSVDEIVSLLSRA